MKRLGCKKDKFDKRDYMHVVRIPKLPDIVDLSGYLPEVRDQGNVGSCVGFGIGSNITAWAKKQKVFSEWFSPTWIYNGARFIEGTLREDSGAYPRDALDWLITKGCLLDHFWPYDSNKLDPTSPPSKFDLEAAKFPMLSYWRITGGTSGICDALAQGNFVSLGSPWYESWMDIRIDGILPNVGRYDSPAGGHETCLYGYDLIKKIFYGMNSWGTSWGKKGHFLIPFQAFNYFNAWGG